MKTAKLILLLCLTARFATAAEAEPVPRDKGWMAHNMSGSCEMIRGGRSTSPSDPAKRLLTVQFMSDPKDTMAIHQGKMMMIFALFSENGVAENERVESFTLLDGDVAALAVIPQTDRWLAFVLDEKAAIALQLFASERLVRAQMKDGSTSVFRFPTKSYASSRAMFDACVQVLRKSA